MDCLLSDISLYIDTVKFPELTKDTLHNCSLIRLGEMTREEALNIENENINNLKAPKELETFLNETKMTHEEFISYVKNWKNIEKSAEF